MVEVSNKSVQLQFWIDRLHAGDMTARQGLLDCAAGRLRQLSRKMLRRYPRVRRWEETDDVLQKITLRLFRAFGQVVPNDVRDFVRLASVNIRRALLDLVKHYYGPRGLDVRQAGTPLPAHEARESDEAKRLEAWSAFHRQAERLPEEQREVFDLLWYQGLSQAEAAGLLGASERTIKRRWLSARLRLFEALHGELPPAD
jgi:RNA polymerase sigma factor (sigma-70 family)